MTKQLKVPEVVNRIATARYDRSITRQQPSLPCCSRDELDARAKAVTDVLKRFLQFPLPLPK
jgi:hypothetical protein